MFKRILKILGYTILVLLLILVVSAFLLTTKGTQNRLAKEATAWLSDKLDTKVEIQDVEIDFLHRVHFKGLYIEDLQNDTLAYINDFSVNSSHIFSDLWSGKTSIIKKARLEGGVVNLLRTADSNKWNYQFVLDAFATEDDEDTTQAKPIDLELKDIDIENVRFVMLDKWGGQEMNAKVGKLALRVNTFDLPKQVFNIKKIDIADTDFAFKDFKGGKPKGPRKVADRSNWGSPFNPDNVGLKIADLNIDNVNFEYQLDGHISKPGRFDEKHIVAKDIQLGIESLELAGDTLTADILNLNVKERSGLAINEMRAKVTLHQQLAELQNLYLRTNHSVVRNYYSMRYKNFHDFNTYINDVSMYARFKNSTIDKRDIAFFSGNISQLPNVTRIDGKAEGTVDNLFIPKVSLRSSNLQYDGSARIMGLPDINNTFFQLEANRLVTTGKELIRIAPEANTGDIKWEELNSIDFKGNFNGTIKKFNADGFVATNQGNADVDLYMNFNTLQPSYKGSVNTDKLNLGKILGQNDIGLVSATGTIDGQGFDFENLSASVDAYVREMHFQGERYEKVKLSGNVANKEFNGIAKSEDPKLGFDFSGNINLSGDEPSYDFKSDILRVNLKTLGITPDDVFLKAKVLLDFKGKNIDEFVGKVILQNVSVRYDTNTINIPQIRLNSYYTDERKKVLDLKSTVADARVEGQYTLTGIDKTVRSFLHYYLPAFIKQEYLPENETYDFNLVVKKNANSIIQIYEPKLTVDSGTVIKGNINTASQNLNLTGLIPGVKYDGIRFGQVGIVSTGTRQLFSSEIVAGEVWANNIQIVSNAKLDLDMSSDTAHVKLITKPLDDFVGEAALDFKARAFNDRISVRLNPSTFILKDDKYRVKSAFPIEYYTDGTLLSKDVIVQNGTQQYIFNSKSENGFNNAYVSSTNIDLERISKYLNLEDYLLKGRVNSEVQAIDIWGKTKITGTLNSVDDFRLNNDTLGTAAISFEYDKEKNELTINEGSKLEHSNNFVKTDGTLNFDKNQINVNAEVLNTPISLASRFVDELVDSLEGFATGGIRVRGPMGNPDIEGKLSLSQAKLKVIFTGCKYSFKDFDINLSNNAITFDPITIYDQRKENRGQALLTGKVTHENYDKYRLRLNATSEDFLGLNTNELDGELFYGYIPAKFDMNITGAIDDITMNIAAKPLPNGRFYLPLGGTSDVGTYDYIKHRDLGRYQDDQIKKRKGASYFKMNMDIEATPDVLATIILDQNTREKIEARGTGNITLNVDLGNDIQMFNTFTVTQGVYLFNFRGLLPKKFELEQGGTITWNGDPYEAKLDMNAIYKANVALYPLVSNELTDGDPDEIRAAKREEETHVKIELSGPLSLPEIKFDIVQPNNRNFGSKGLATLERIRQDQNELIYQAGMILLFNSFKSVGSGVSAGNLASTTGISTVSDAVSSTLSPLLNDAFNRLTGINNIDFNFNYKNYSTDVTSNDALYRRNQFDIGLQGRFFKDRLIVTYGNSFDIGNQNSALNTNNSIIGDFKAEYLLSPDGRFKLNGYRVSTNEIDATEQTLNRGGIGISFRKSFNTWRGLFSSKKSTITSAPTPILAPEKEEIREEQKTGSIKVKEPSDTTALGYISKVFLITR